MAGGQILHIAERVRRAVLVALFAALACAAVPSVAAAGPCPVYDGGMGFPEITGPEGPEDYCFEVTLNEEQELQQIDDQTVQVFQSGGFPSFTITAEKAHDAEGATVPTTLAKTGRNIVTLTVHHREGNPAAGGAPFDYPVVGGVGWEGGFQTVEVQMSPTTEQTAAPQTSAPKCDVPALQGRTLKAARRALEHADCRLGPVHGRHRRGAKVVKQYRRYGAVLPAGTEVGVKLA
jgi:hypothetical protein